MSVRLDPSATPISSRRRPERRIAHDPKCNVPNSDCADVALRVAKAQAAPAPSDFGGRMTAFPSAPLP
jgi:hypothetical protein